jgi:hypothetical protein
LIAVLETAFRNRDHVATAEWKVEVLKQLNYNFSTHDMKF